MKVGDALYLPWGYFVMPLYYVSEAKAGSWAHIWTLAIATAGSMSTGISSKEACKAIGTYNADRCKTARVSFWAARKDYLVEFLEPSGLQL